MISHTFHYVIIGDRIIAGNEVTPLKILQSILLFSGVDVHYYNSERVDLSGMKSFYRKY